MPGPMFNKQYARLGFRCRCEICVAECGPSTKKIGKFWQPMYGEPTNVFKKRFYAWHRARRLTRQKKLIHVQTTTGDVIKVR